MTQICQVNRLIMNHRMEVCPAGANLIVMYSKMRIELSGNALKTAMIRCKKLTGLSPFIDNNAGDVGCWLVDDFAQSSSRTADKESCTREFRNRLRQFYTINHWETS